MNRECLGLSGTTVIEREFFMEWNIGCIVSKRSSATPDKVAMIYEGRSITYRELNERTNRVAAFLQARGLKNGDRISVLMLNCPELIEIYFAAAKLGIIFVPLNFRLVGPELEYQINNCDSRLLVFHDCLLKNIEPILSTIHISQDSFLFKKSGETDCPRCPDWTLDYDDVMGAYPVDEPLPERPVLMDDPLAILYTSGVTGLPKGAVLTHSQTFFKNFQIIIYTDMRSDDVFLSQLPLFHSGGLFITATPVFCRGATLIARRKFNAVQFAEDIERYRATIVFALTTMWRFIIQSGRLDEVDTGSVRVTMGGGERTPLTLFDELAKRGIHLQNGFGQTENSYMTLMPAECIHLKKGSIGKPGFFTNLEIQDQNGNRCPPGAIGEIVAKGPTVMSGYWKLPDETAKAITNGVLHTGDYGYMDEDGFFYIVDRVKDMYRTGGENVYPAEIEKVLASHPKIFNVSIIGVPDEKWGETGMAFIIPEEGEHLTLNEVHDFLKGKVAKYKFPTQVKFVDQLPLTATGKIMKVRLKEKYGVRLDA